MIKEISVVTLVTIISVFGFAALPISGIVTSAIHSAPTNTLSHIAPHILAEEAIGFKVMLGFSAFIVLSNVVLALLFGLKDKGFASTAFPALGTGLAISGLATCGFYLDTLNKIKTQSTCQEIFTIITKNNTLALQELISTEKELIIGVVVLSALVAGLAALTAYNISKW